MWENLTSKFCFAKKISKQTFQKKKLVSDFQMVIVWKRIWCVSFVLSFLVEWAIIIRYREERKKKKMSCLLSKPFPFFLLFLGASSLLYSAGYWCHQWTRWRLLGVRPNSRYILLMQCYQVYILRPITTHNPLSNGNVLPSFS